MAFHVPLFLDIVFALLGKYDSKGRNSGQWPDQCSLLGTSTYFRREVEIRWLREERLLSFMPSCDDDIDTLKLNSNTAFRALRLWRYSSVFKPLKRVILGLRCVARADQALDCFREFCNSLIEDPSSPAGGVVDTVEVHCGAHNELFNPHDADFRSCLNKMCSSLGYVKCKALVIAGVESTFYNYTQVEPHQHLDDEFFSDDADGTVQCTNPTSINFSTPLVWSPECGRWSVKLLQTVSRLEQLTFVDTGLSPSDLDRVLSLTNLTHLTKLEIDEANVHSIISRLQPTRGLLSCLTELVLHRCDPDRMSFPVCDLEIELPNLRILKAPPDVIAEIMRCISGSRPRLEWMEVLPDISIADCRQKVKYLNYRGLFQAFDQLSKSGVFALSLDINLIPTEDAIAYFLSSETLHSFKEAFKSLRDSEVNFACLTIMIYSTSATLCEQMLVSYYIDHRHFNCSLEQR